MIIVKSPREIGLVREAARVVAVALEEIREYIVPGVSTQALNDKIDQIVRREGAYPGELGYYGYPASVCASVNECILHGIPSKKKILRDGDIITTSWLRRMAIAATPREPTASAFAGRGKKE